MGSPDKMPFYLIAYAALFVPYFIWGVWGLAATVFSLLVFHVVYRIKTGRWMDFTD